MFEAGTRVEVYSWSNTIAYFGVVTEPGTSEICESPECSRCKDGSHTPVRQDGEDYSMGIHTSHVSREGTRARGASA